MKTSAIIRIIIWALVALLLVSLLAWGLGGAQDGGGWFKDWFPSVNWNLNLWGSGFTRYRYEDESRYSIGGASLSAADITAVQVDWIDGGVTVLTGDTQQVTFSETAPGNLKEEYRLRYYLDNGVLRIKYCASGARLNFGRSPNKELTVVVPASLALAELHVNTVSGQISATNGMRADQLRLNTTSGSVRLEQVTGQNAVVNSVSGAVRLAEVTVPEISVESVSGEVRIEQVTADRLTVESVSGGTWVTKGQVGELRCETVSGNVSAEPGQTVQRIAIESVSGSVKLSLPPAISGFTVRHESISGELACDFPVSFPQKNQAVYNDGSVRVELSTVSGDMRIERLP